MEVCDGRGSGEGERMTNEESAALNKVALALKELSEIVGTPKDKWHEFSTLFKLEADGTITLYRQYLGKPGSEVRKAQYLSLERV